MKRPLSFIYRVHCIYRSYMQIGPHTGMAALCAAILVDRGHLDYNQKVVHYWPEFGQKGKENVTVKMLLNHEVRIEIYS